MVCEWLTLPDVPVTVTGKAPIGVWAESLPQPATSNTVIIRERAIRNAADRRRLFGTAKNTIPSRPSPADGIQAAYNGLGCIVFGSINEALDPVVVMVKVTLV